MALSSRPGISSFRNCFLS